MYVVKINQKQPFTIFENVVFILDILVFSICTVFSLLSKEYSPAFGFIGFVLFGIICLQQTNAVLACVHDDYVVIRKFLKKYRFELKQVENVEYKVFQRRYEVIFSGKKFSVPYEYINSQKFISSLKMVNNYFATKEGIEKIKNYIKQNASAESFLLLPDKNITPTIFSSKIGGLPYWDLSIQYPLDSAGNKMHLLCQINFSDCKFENPILPKNGILQFFISSSDEFYGMNWENAAEQKNWRIVFHEQINSGVKAEDIRKIVPEISMTPVLNGFALKFSKSVSYMNDSDYRMDRLMEGAIKEILHEDSAKSIYELLGTEEENPYSAEIYKMLQETENYILGFPSFIQEDVRQNMSEEEASYYDTTLLHLDSSSCSGEAMCWGDMGCANFLINSDALKKRDFSKVYYTWDCF